MATPVLSGKPLPSWKRIAIRSIFGGAAFAVTLAGVFGIFLWYSSRPKPPKLWDTSALVAKAPPDFSVSDDGKRVEFSYAVENTTNTDYQLDSDTQIKVVLKTEEGTISPPLGSEAPVKLPVFIPAKQRAFVTVSLALTGIPEKRAGESNEQFHDRLRTFCDDYLSGVVGFLVFDDVNRYQLNLARWLHQPPVASTTTNSSQGDPLGLFSSSASTVGATKAYRGFTYTFDGKKWLKGSKALKYSPATNAMEPLSNDQYDPLNLLSKEEKAKRLLTEPRIRQVANQFGVSYEEALDDAKAQGYQVPPKD